MKNQILTVVSFVGVLALSFASAKAQLIITEVDPAGSSSSSPDTGYAGDWFELTNYGSSSVSIAGDLVIDSHSETSNSGDLEPLLGVTSIAAGQSVVFLDYSGQSGTLTQQEAEEQTAFDEAWFGSSTAPAGDVFGYYNGSSIGLSQTNGDEVNILTSAKVQIAGVSFGNDSTASPTPTFDNSVAKLNSTTQANDATVAELTTFSAVGTDDAFESANKQEIGSPDEVSNAPEPSTWALFGLTGLLVLAWRRRGLRLGL